MVSGCLLAGVVASGCGSEPGSDFDDQNGASSGASGDSSSLGSGGITGPSSGGTSSSGGGSGGPTCATARASTTRQPIYLFIILDGSGSMDGYADVTPAQSGQCVAGTYRDAAYGPDICQYTNASETDPLQNNRRTGKKWIAARGALKAYLDAKAAVASPQLGVGLYLFSSTDSDYRNVELLDPAHADTLWGLIAPGTWPTGGTPLRSAILGTAEFFRDEFTPDAPLAPEGRRVMLLITDGVPDGTGGGTKTSVRQAVVDSLGDDPSIATAVIGVGDPNAPADVFDETFLSSLALAGGVAPAGCNENWGAGDAPGTSCHLQVTPGEKTAQQLQEEMAAAIDSIAGSLASCELALEKSSPIDPAKVNVLYVTSDGAEAQVPQSSDNGWTYDNPDDPSKVILHGEACERLKADPTGEVRIVIGCPTGTSVVN